MSAEVFRFVTIHAFDSRTDILLVAKTRWRKESMGECNRVVTSNTMKTTQLWQSQYWRKHSKIRSWNHMWTIL